MAIARLSEPPRPRDPSVSVFPALESQTQDTMPSFDFGSCGVNSALDTCVAGILLTKLSLSLSEVIKTLQC